ncbi:hypothetical protein SLEP1_g25112 [Rubroshorea leprosula]|uniref:Uncharacterized protein n=1 Tax=Rubroshorea leprosula TaxID=152421 RepID=A0AAV5JI38_9ROSI|nr:hypothetical protein SLEP1_g25112 [Rubroshorea leprosula]
MDSELINTVSSSPSPPPLAAAHCRDISRKKRVCICVVFVIN